MLRDLLNLTTVAVSRETETNDGMGGISVSATATTLIAAAIWASGSWNRWMSERMTRDSTHVLVCEPSAYSWGQDDRKVTYGGQTYKIVGRPDNVWNKGEIIVVPLELQS